MPGRGKAYRGPVDWAGIRSRVEAAGLALTGVTEARPEHVRAVLEDRARALARPTAAPPLGSRLEAVTFVLADECYAIESRYVVEVVRFTHLSPLPGAERPVLGVTAWRGELLTILDVRAALGLAAAPLNTPSRVIVLGEDRPAFGILADAVPGLVTLPASEVREPPDGFLAKREYLRGVTADAVLVLDAEQLLRIHA